MEAAVVWRLTGSCPSLAFFVFFELFLDLCMLQNKAHHRRLDASQTWHAGNGKAGGSVRITESAASKASRPKLVGSLWMIGTFRIADQHTEHVPTGEGGNCDNTVRRFDVKLPSICPVPPVRNSSHPSATPKSSPFTALHHRPLTARARKR
jgi:hypothetical protein